MGRGKVIASADTIQRLNKLLDNAYRIGYEHGYRDGVTGADNLLAVSARLDEMMEARRNN